MVRFAAMKWLKRLFCRDDPDELHVRFLGDMQRLKVEPGDRIVLMCNQRLTIEQREFLLKTLRENFPGGKPIVLGDGMRLGVLSVPLEDVENDLKQDGKQGKPDRPEVAPLASVKVDQPMR